MPVWKAYYATQAEAEEAAALASDRALAALTALSADAGQVPALASAGVRTRVLSAGPVPAGSVPSASPATSLVVWETTPPGAGAARSASAMPTAQVPGQGRTAGTVRLSAGAGLSVVVRVRARVASGVQVTGAGGPTTTLNGGVSLPTATITVFSTVGFPATGKIWVGNQLVAYTGTTATTFTGCTGGTGSPADGSVVALNVAVPAGSGVTDPASAKVYLVAASQNAPCVGVATIAVAEEDTAAAGDLTYGALVEFDSPPAGLSRQAVVCRMSFFFVAGGAPMTHPASGRHYQVVSDVTVAADTSDNFAGYRESSVAVSSLLDDGLSAEVDDPIEFDNILKVQKAAAVTTAFSKLIPAGTVFQKPGYSYATTAAVTMGDSLGISAPFTAAAEGSGYDFPAVPAAVTLPAPPDSVSASASVTAQTPSVAYPQDRVPVQFGDEVALDTFVAREPDGRWSVRLATLPLGT